MVNSNQISASPRRIYIITHHMSTLILSPDLHLVDAPDLQSGGGTAGAYLAANSDKIHKKDELSKDLGP